MISHELHIRPWELENLTVDEFRAAVHWVAEKNKKEDDDGCRT